MRIHSYVELLSYNVMLNSLLPSSTNSQHFNFFMYVGHSKEYLVQNFGVAPLRKYLNLTDDYIQIILLSSSVVFL